LSLFETHSDAKNARSFECVSLKLDSGVGSIQQRVHKHNAPSIIKGMWYSSAVTSDIHKQQQTTTTVSKLIFQTFLIFVFAEFQTEGDTTTATTTGTTNRFDFIILNSISM
jgi:hypothetical protein